MDKPKVTLERDDGGNIVITEDTENFWDAVGNDILSSLPKERQRVKWWRVHNPYISHHKNCMDKRWTVNLPHFSYSRSWVGYVFIHTRWFNRWSVLLTFGHWSKEDKNG